MFNVKFYEKTKEGEIQTSYSCAWYTVQCIKDGVFEVCIFPELRSRENYVSATVITETDEPEMTYLCYIENSAGKTIQRIGNRFPSLMN